MTSASSLATTAAANPIAAEMLAIDREFEALNDWSSKLAHLVKLGRELPVPPPQSLTDANRVHGCQSQLWLVATRQGDTVHLEADSDAALMRGVLALLLRLYGDRSARDILNHLTSGTECLEVLETLAPSRITGVLLVLRRIEAVALEGAS